MNISLVSHHLRWFFVFLLSATVKTRINGQCARTLDLPLLVRFVFFYFFFVSGDAFFGVFSPPFPEEEISDDIAHGPFIRVFTVFFCRFSG